MCIYIYICIYIYVYIHASHVCCPGPAGDTAFAKICKSGAAKSTRGKAGLSMAVARPGAPGSSAESAAPVFWRKFGKIHQLILWIVLKLWIYIYIYTYIYIWNIYIYMKYIYIWNISDDKRWSKMIKDYQRGCWRRSYELWPYWIHLYDMVGCRIAAKVGTSYNLGKS